MNLIVALDLNNGIGFNNEIPWYLPEDLKYFKKITTGNIVVMGKNTHKSIGKLLDNRINIILSHNVMKNCITVSDLNGVINKYKNNNIFIIGGSSVYKQFINECKYLYITKIYKSFNCDTFFPKYENNFNLVSESDIKTFKDIKYQFCIYEKK